jgi:hypothetical protein
MRHGGIDPARQRGPSPTVMPLGRIDPARLLRRIGQAAGRRIGQAAGRRIGQAAGRRIGQAAGRRNPAVASLDRPDMRPSGITPEGHSPVRAEPMRPPASSGIAPGAGTHQP